MMRNWTVAGTGLVLAAAACVWAARREPAPRGTAAFSAPTATTATTAAAAAATPEAAAGPAVSCKPAVPLTLELVALGADRWRLQCTTTDQDRDVRVWMWSGPESTRREVWRGPLRQGVAQVLEVGFTPPDAAAAVWAAAEAFAANGDGMRSVAQVSPHGRDLPGIAANPGTLQQDPISGERILQFTGTTEAGR